MRFGELNLGEAAKQAAGNWRQFDCFVWFRRNELEDADQWAVIYTHHRDSGLLDQSNAAVIEKALKSFNECDDPDVVFESHNHWAVGYINGFSVRVFKNSEITKTFETYHKLARQIADYPVLDEEDYSNREFEATLDNINDAAWRLKREFVLPDGWESEVYGWLSGNFPSEIENTDDRGGNPSESALLETFSALGFESSKNRATT